MVIKSFSFLRTKMFTKFERVTRSADVDTCIVPTIRGHVPVLATGVFPLPAPGSGTACRRNCDGQTLSLANSVDH